jgi:predicted flap endonuclease-1-like 5' DNA nuclease
MNRNPRWWLLLIPIAGVVLFAIWWRRCQAQRERAANTPVEFTIPIDDSETEVAILVPRHEGEADSGTQVAPCKEDMPDDMTEIEGIGPKISTVLAEEGIKTFAQLAATGVEELERILREAGIRLAYPETWPEQAELAAQGKWELLAALQDHLYRGRRV